MKKVIIVLFVTAALTGCMKEEFCPVQETPANLHPVMSCADCEWNEK